MNRINHKRFHLSNPLSWSWNQTFCAARIHSNIQIETTKLQNIPSKCIDHFPAWRSQVRPVHKLLGARGLATQAGKQTRSVDSETGLMEMSQHYTWGSKNVCKRSVFTSQMELFDLAFYFKMPDPLPSVARSICCCLGEQARCFWISDLAGRKLG